MASYSQHPDNCSCDDCLDEYFIQNHMQMTMVGGMNALSMCHHYVTHCLKIPMRDSALPGYQWVQEIWNGHDIRFFESMRMRKPVLRLLIDTCIRNGMLNPKTRHVSLEESMAIFLLIVGQRFTYPAVAERLQRSTEIICNHFHMVLKAICKLGKMTIKPLDPTFQSVDPILAANPRYFAAFKDYIGAIDGTHIGVHVPDHEKVPWTNRKSVTTTNVLAICDFNMCIIFANVGCEGSMHDARVLIESMTNPKHNFPFSPTGKYYLADAGYPIMNGFLIPYPRTRYHIPEFRENRNFRSKNEVFNYRHSSMRSVIERTFGVLKKRWRVLNTMAMVDIKTQIRIIWACIAIHNFIRRSDSDDLQLLGDIPLVDEDLSSRLRPLSHEEWKAISIKDENDVKIIRDSIRDALVGETNICNGRRRL